jgi:hypothetical protein
MRKKEEIAMPRFRDCDSCTADDGHCSKCFDKETGQLNGNYPYWKYEPRKPR